MSIRVKSEELRRYFRNNGLVTDEAAQSIFNRINIELVTTTNGKVSQDLLDDLVLINATYPQLLRHTTIINTTGSEVDLQPIIDVLATYPNKSFDTLKSLTIRSKYDSDFNLDYSKLIDLDRLVLSGGNRVSKVTFDPKKLTVKHSPLKEFELELENFDLSGLDSRLDTLEGLVVGGEGEGLAAILGDVEKLKTEKQDKLSEGSAEKPHLIWVSETNASQTDKYAIDCV